MKTGTDLLAGRRREGGVYKGRDDYLLEEIAAPDEEQTDKSVELIGEYLPLLIFPAPLTLLPALLSLSISHALKPPPIISV